MKQLLLSLFTLIGIPCIIFMIFEVWISSKPGVYEFGTSSFGQCFIGLFIILGAIIIARCWYKDLS